jgi:hypothetical protein
MIHFYAKADEEYRCRKAVLRKDPITITGLTEDGRVCTATGRVQSVEAGHRLIPGYPLRVKVLDSDPKFG